MLRFLFWVLLLYWLLVIVGRAVRWILGIRPAQNGEAAKQREGSRRLHRDPVCGTHVAEEISFALREGGTTLYFCSEECRRKYAAEGKKGVSKEA